MRNVFKTTLIGIGMAMAMAIVMGIPSANAIWAEQRIIVKPYVKNPQDPFWQVHTDGAHDRLLDKCDGNQQTCTKRLWVQVVLETAFGRRTYLPYDIDVHLVISRRGDFFEDGPGVTNKTVRIRAGRPGLIPYAAFWIKLAMDNKPDYPVEGGVSVGITDITPVNHGYDPGLAMELVPVEFSITDRTHVEIPNYRVVAQSPTVQEGDPITFELRGNKNPNFKMRVRVDYAFPNGDRFFDLDSRYRNVLLDPNSGEDIGNGEYRFATFTVDTFSDGEATDGAIAANIGNKKTGWHWYDQSWGLQPSERTPATVIVRDNGRSADIPNYRVVTRDSTVTEGSPVTFELRGNKNPNFKMRVRVDYAFPNGDHFFDLESRYRNILMDSNSGEYIRPGEYRFATFTVDTVLDLEETRDGILTAVIGDKKNGWHWYDQSWELQPSERIGRTVTVKNSEAMVISDITHVSSVAEGSTIAFQLTGIEKPEFDMRIRVNFAYAGDFFGSNPSAYTYVNVGPSLGSVDANGVYRSNEFDIPTVLDQIDETNGSVTATIGVKRVWHSDNHTLIPLTAEERAVSSTVIVEDSAFSEFQIVSTLSSDNAATPGITEGAPILFKLRSDMQPNVELRIHVSFAYAGDFFGENPPATTIFSVGPDIGVYATGGYSSPPHVLSTVDDDVEEHDGSVVATISRKQLGASGFEQDVLLTSNEQVESLTVAVLDNDVPNYFLEASSPTVSAGDVAFWQIMSLGQTSYATILTIRFVDIGAPTLFDSVSSTIENYDIPADSGSEVTDRPGVYLQREIGRATHGTTNDLIYASISSITTVIPTSNGTDTRTKNIPTEEQTLVSVTIGRDSSSQPEPTNDGPNYFLETVSPSIGPGDIAFWRIMSLGETTYATSITIRYVDIGAPTLFGPVPSTIEIYELKADSGSEVADRPGVFFHRKIGRSTDIATTSDLIYAAITSITETIPTSDGTNTRTRNIPFNEQILARIAISEQSSSQSRSLGAMHAYREVIESHESDVVDESTEGTQEQISLAFDRPSTMDVQSFVETVGTSINSGADLSELVNMPSFTMPLTSGTEVTGPLTMWIDSNDSDTLAVGHIGMDLSMYDSYVFGMTVSSLESELSEDISEDMNMVQSYLAYKPNDSDVHVSAIVGFGAGDLTMEEFGSFETSRILAQFGIHGDLASYGTESIDGNLKVDATAGISEHTVQETGQYYGWTTIGRNASIAASSEHAISTPLGTFNPTIWTEFDSRLESGGGLTFDDLKPYGLNLSAWINGESPDSAKNFTADVKYGFSTTDSVVITPSLELATNNGLSHTLGVSIANDIFDFGGDVTDNSRYGINGAVRW